MTVSIDPVLVGAFDGDPNEGASDGARDGFIKLNSNEQNIKTAVDALQGDFLNKDGTVALTGNWAVGGFDVTGLGDIGIGVDSPDHPLDMIGTVRGTSTLTDATTKTWSFRVRNYTNALADFNFFTGSSWTNRNQVDFGGGGGGISATRIDFYTHPTPTTSDTANNTRRMRLTDVGLLVDPGGLTAATMPTEAGDFVGSVNTTTGFKIGGSVQWTSGAGTPEAAVTAPVGSLFSRTDGGAGTTLYVKESGAGNTGWVGK